MTLPITESLGGRLVLYLAVSVVVYDPDEGSRRHFFNKHVITCPNQVVTRQNGISSPEVRAVEACDSSCKGGLILSAERMKSGQSDLSSVLLRSTQLLTLWQQQQQLTVFRQHTDIPVKKKKKKKKARHSKSLIIQGLSVQVVSPLHHPEHRVGRTLTFDHTESVDVFSLCKPGVCADKSAVNPGLIQPISPVFSFHLLFISPHLSGMMTVSHNAGQREPGCSWAKCWKACAITPAPCCERCSDGGTERESGELLIPCTIGHLNPRQAPYLHWAKALPEPYDRAGGMITPRLAARDP